MICQPCSFFPRGRGNPPSQSRIPLFRSSPNLRPWSFNDRLDFPEQLHNPPGAGSAAWTTSPHPLPNFPHDELNRHSPGFDCGAPSPGSIPSGASTEGSLSLPQVAMSNGEGAPSGQETPTRDWKTTSDDNITGAFDWEFNSTFPLEYAFNIDANDLFVNGPAYASADSIPTFQFPLDHSLPHRPYNQDGLTTPGLELSGPESINLSGRQAQDGPWAMNSLGPQSMEYAPSNLGRSVYFHDIV
jgi:hypothetical protein